MTRIIIVDDNVQNLYLLETIFKGYGYEVIAAKNGKEALSLAKKIPPDIIISDILMPVMDGFELCRQWKADDKLKKIPFIFYTATYIESRDKQFALSLGAERYIIKPEKPDVLGQIVNDVLEEYRQKKASTASSLRKKEKETVYQYNEILFHKLEKKVIQLEKEIDKRKKTEKALNEGENKYRKLYESMRDAIFSTDMDGRIKEYNNAYKIMLGYNDEELPKLTNMEITPKKWRQFEDGIMKKQLLTYDYSDVYEKEYIRKDGVVFPVEVRAFLIRDDNGRPSGMWAIARDITARKLAEEALRRNEYQFRTLFMSLSEGFYLSEVIYDEKGIPCDYRFLEVNPKFEQILGLSRDRIIGKRYKELVPLDTSQWLDNYCKVAITGEPLKYEFYSNEYRMYFETYSFKTSVNQVNVLVINITERKLAEEALRINEAKYRTLTENLPDFVARFDTDLRYIYVNQAAGNIIGLPGDDFIGKTNEELGMPDKYSAVWNERILQVFKEAKPQTFEIDISTVKGIRHLSSLSVPEFDDDGKINSVLTVARDVTEHKKAEEEIESLARFPSENPNPVLRINKSGTLLYINTAAFSQLSDWNLKIGDKVPEHLQRLILETFNLHKVTEDFMSGGHIFSITAVNPPAKEYVNLYVQDITERKRAEEEIIKANRVYAVISQINQMIVHVRKRSRLFSEACKITVKYGKFLMAWIGLPDEKEQMIIPVAWEGVEGNYSSITDKISIKSLIERHDPAGMAINEGRYALCNDIAGDPCLLPFHKEALKRSYGSLIALPILLHNKVIGVFMIYAHEAFFFNDSEIKLLEEVTGDISYALEMIENEKKRKQAEKALQESENKYRKIFENTQDVFYQIDSDGRINEISPSISKVSGYTREELLGKPIEEVYYRPEDRNELLKILMEKEELIDYDVKLKTKNGQLKWASLNVRLIPDLMRKNYSIEGSIRDVTERKLAEEELQRYRDHLEDLVNERTVELRNSENNLKHARDQAETANRAKTAFLSSMSHEIRTPLNAILGFSQLMLNDAELSGQKREWIDTINRSGEHLLALINDILEISKIEAGRTALNSELFNLKGFIEDLENMFKSKLNEKNLVLLMDIDKNLPEYIELDGNKFRQIFINLVGNAVKFTDKGKITVHIRTGKGEDGKPRLYSEIEDTGPGIQSEDIKRIFEKFEQTALSVKKGGTGLGLSISRNFAKLMGGDIKVKSEPGKGSVFFLELDYNERENLGLKDSTDGRQVIGLEEGQPAYRILIVDDEPANRKLLKELLIKTGFTVEEASGGKEAIEKYKIRPDLIFLDMRMPEIDGYETVKIIESMERGVHIPVIAVTAFAFAENKKKILKAGVDGYIRKPYKIHEIYDILKTFLGVRYIYGEECVETADKIPDVLPEKFPDLPVDLIDEMLSSARKLDMNRLLELIDETGKLSPQTAKLLRNLAKCYKYDELIQLLNRRK